MRILYSDLFGALYGRAASQLNSLTYLTHRNIVRSVGVTLFYSPEVGQILRKFYERIIAENQQDLDSILQLIDTSVNLGALEVLTS